MSFLEDLEGQVTAPFMDLVREFLDAEEGGFQRGRMSRVGAFRSDWFTLAEMLGETDLCSEVEIGCLRLMIMAGRVSKETDALAILLGGGYRERVLEVIAETDPRYRPSMVLLARGVLAGSELPGPLAADATAQEPFMAPVSNWLWGLGHQVLRDALAVVPPSTDLCVALVRYKPELLKTLLAGLAQSGDRTLPADTWSALVDETDAVDELFIAALEKKRATTYQAWRLGSSFTFPMVAVLARLNARRGGAHSDLLVDVASLPGVGSSPEVVDALAEHDPQMALPLVAAALEYDAPYMASDGYRALLAAALEDVAGTGKMFLLELLRLEYGLSDLREQAMDALLAADVKNPEGVRALLLEVPEDFKGKRLSEFWKKLATQPGRLFDAEFRAFLSGKSKVMREIAASYLAAMDLDGAPVLARELAAAKGVNDRLGAVALLSKLGEAGVADLQAMHAGESNRKVHEAIEGALGKVGAPILAAEVSGDASLSDLEASISKDKHLRAPKRKWMALDGLVLKDASGKALSARALHFLIQQQIKHKTIEAAPGIVPLLAHLPREQNCGVGATLLEQWIASDQAASDRWVLTLAGLLGDGRVVPPIGAGIHRWCKALRKELAECGVRALALLGVDEALMVLNDVAQRYTSKALNVGRAAAEAFQAEANARGVDLEALRDMVVPDLGFDAENVRVISCGEAVTHAMLNPDGVLTWRNPDTGKETKNPPAKLPAEVKAEIKGLRALLRETVKSQTARLELAMVCQRRWSLADWKSLFEGNPLMRAFSSRLVFGVYDAEHNLRSMFRRYPNGITADAAGEMVEVEDGGCVIGLVHPLELDEELLAAWREHLERFEITPPFPQLTRPAHAVDPTHGNRRELQTVKGTQMAQGTLFLRSERLGWHRGSVVGHGELCSVYKVYAAAGIEAILELHEFYMGGGWDSWGNLGRAMFVKSGTVERGSYEMDAPQHDDPRVLTFGKVPPIVYSETVSDLKTIAGA